MRQINLLLMPEDIQLCEKTKVKPVTVKPSEIGKKKEPEKEESVIDNVINYKYEDGFEYTNVPEITGKEDIIIDYLAEASDYQPKTDGTAVATADLARLLGAFYRTEKVDPINYEGVSYSWNEELGLKGSNYANGETTLVSAVAQQLVAKGIPFEALLTTDKYNITLKCGVK